MNSHYRIAQRLISYVRHRELHVLSGGILTEKKCNDVILSTMLKNVESRKAVKFIRGLLNAHYAMSGWNYKDLLQQLMDCAMTCHELRFEQYDCHGNVRSLELREHTKVLAERCFAIARTVIEGAEPSPILLLNCIVCCRVCIEDCQQAEGAMCDKLLQSCISCEEACLMHYQKSSSN